MLEYTIESYDIADKIMRFVQDLLVYSILLPAAGAMYLCPRTQCPVKSEIMVHEKTMTI